MMEASVAQGTIERIVEELDRLKAARPHLASRIDRAETILTVQLSVANGMRPIKARLAADGSRSYAVKSNSKLREVYSVEAGSFRCDCPDATKRNAACKHGLACWVFERAAGMGGGRS